MSKNNTILALAVVSGAAILNCGCSRATAQSDAKAVTENPNRSVELVVYSGNFAMVNETRNIDLARGRVRIGLQEVSKKLDQGTVVYSFPDEKGANVISSTYDMGIGESGRLLQRFLGKKVDVVFRGDNGKEGERISGILEVAEPGNVVIKTDDKYIVNPNATIEAPTGEGIVAIPQLSAEVDSQSDAHTKLGLTYLTEGISWQADYTATLDTASETMNLECWAMVTNLTGTDFPNAKLKFVAGSPNRAVVASSGRLKYDSTLMGVNYESSGYMARKSMSYGAGQGVSTYLPATSMGELYAYPYEAKSTIKQDQMNRVKMVAKDGVKIKKTYGIRLPYVTTYGVSMNPDQRISATLGLNLVNDAKSGLGEPLPAGALRIYEPDANGVIRYIGAGNMDNLPKDARHSVTLTESFDVYAKAKSVSAKKVDKKTMLRTMEVTLHNEKAAPIEVRVVQDFYGSWKIVSESVKSGKLSSGSNQWKVKIPAGGTTTLKYAVTIR